MELTDRKKQILKVVVEDYVRTAEPVGSKAIAAEMGGVSSATIRNELSDLTELGYLEQPHTSAGRVPSPKGYRLYVNELMERQRLSIAETERINQSLQMRMEELDRVISQAGRAVSSLMNYPAYVAATGKKQMTARRFELLPVDEHSCIVVMMMVMMAAAALAVMVVMVVLMLVRVLGSCFVAVEPGHIVIVVLELLCQLNVKVAGVDAMLVYARYSDRKAVDRQRGELFAQMLLAGAQVEQGRDGHIAADARSAVDDKRVLMVGHGMLLNGRRMCRRSDD